jgi:predicted nuclease of predicted toxin-antitoxin system
MSASDLRFLADESCDFAVVRALRAEGYDVLAVSEVTQRSDDRELIDQAHGERRILLTEDKDFGWLVYVSRVVLVLKSKVAMASRSRDYGQLNDSGEKLQSTCLSAF